MVACWEIAETNQNEKLFTFLNSRNPWLGCSRVAIKVGKGSESDYDQNLFGHD